MTVFGELVALISISTDIHAPERYECFVLREQVLVVLENHCDEFRRRDESNAWLGARKVLRRYGIGSERHEKTALRFRHLRAEGGNFLVSDCSSSALQLDPDHGTFESEFIAMAN